MKRIALVLLFVSCGGEPPFIQACQDECSCTGESFACKPPRTDGCDNSYRRAWTVAGQKSAACQSAYEAYFNCLATKSVCTGSGFKSWAPPNGVCDSVERPYRDCQ